MSHVLLLIASALLLFGLPAVPAPGPLAGLVSQSVQDRDCCPGDDDEEGDDEGDCCDWDFGACCASGMLAALPSARTTVSPPLLAQVETHAALPVHLLRPRNNGPPPLPPPIG